MFTLLAVMKSLRGESTILQTKDCTCSPLKEVCIFAPYTTLSTITLRKTPCMHTSTPTLLFPIKLFKHQMQQQVHRQLRPITTTAAHLLKHGNRIPIVVLRLQQIIQQ